MRRWYEPRKDRPDIPKDAPKKKGIVRFLETLWREFYALLKLHLLFLLSCIPVVTIPAAITAMSRITITMVQDRTSFLWADYWQAFKRDFGKSLPGGLALLGMLAVFGISTWFYYQLMLQNRFFVILAGASACLLLSTLMMSLYFFPMLASVELSLGQLLKNSCILTFVNMKRSLPALVLWLLLLGLGVGMLPYSAPYALLIMWSLTSLVTSFLLYPAIENRVLEREPEPSHHDSYEELQSAQLGDFPEPEEKRGED